MVYCGRPSGGCYACRERKSRCDKVPEGCTQCKKAKRECPGYRQLGDVIFHNESEKVARKAKAKEAKNRAKREQADVQTSNISSRHQDQTATTGVAFHARDQTSYQSFNLSQARRASLSNFILLPPIEELADGFFVSGFVSKPEGEHGPGRFDYIADDYRNYSLDEGLLASMRAVGFASYAHTSKSPELLNKARIHYTQAIKFTNKAIASLELAKKDTTLLSILVLGIFETITGAQTKSLKDWSSHIQGAAAVIALRGRDQIKSMAGKRMLFQVTSNLMITCIARKKPLPNFIFKYTEAAVDAIENPDPALHVQRTMMRAAQLRADVASGNINDLQAILVKASELDNALLVLTQNPPPGWGYEIVYTGVDSPYVWKGEYHVYADCWVSQLWNSVRTIRVILNELIRDVLLRGFSSNPSLFPHSSHTVQFQRSTDILYILQAEILHSVPQHLFALPSPSTIQKIHANMDGQAPVKEKDLRVEQKEGQERLEMVLLTNQPLAEAVVGSLLPGPRSVLTQEYTLAASSSSSLTSKSTFSTSSSIATGKPNSFPASSDRNAQSSSSNFSSHSQPASKEESSQPTPIPPNSPIPCSLSCQRKSTAAARTYGGNFLMWPLWFAGVMDVATDEVRTFVIRNLRDVGENLGLKQGWVLADLLESGKWKDV